MFDRSGKGRRAAQGRPLDRRGRGFATAGFVAASMAGLTCHGAADPERYLLFSVGEVTLRPQLEIAETYDSNIFYKEEDPEDDFITSVRPGLRVVYGDLTENFISLRYTLDASFYADRHDLNNVGHFVSHQSRFAFARLTIQAEDEFSLTDGLLGGTYSYIERRVGQLAWSSNWRADYMISPRSLVGLSASVDWVEYDENDLAPFHLYDFVGYSGGLRVGYLPSERITIFPQVTYGRSTLSRNFETVANAPDLSHYGFSIGIEGEFTPKLSGLVSGGYEFRSYEDDTDVPDGWVANARLVWLARPKTTVTLGYRHWIHVSQEVFGYAATAHRVTLGIRQEIGTQGRWTANLFGWYQISNYERDVLLNGREIQREDKLAGVTLSASYRWYSWLVASVAYDFRTLDDNIPTIQNYEVHRVSLRLLAGY